VSKPLETGQLLIITVTAIGTLLANAALEWVKNFLQARDRRKESSDAVVIKQIDINAQATEDLHEWWQSQVKENQGLFERAVKAESERDGYKRDVEELQAQNAEYARQIRELLTKATLIEWIEKEKPEDR
jgi:hypothetical protein